MASAQATTNVNNSTASTMAAVANEFLRLQREDHGYPVIDQMKLQKLLFYAHAWYMAYNERRPLFDDDFEAWPWGPVVRDAYLQTLDCGKGPVEAPLSELAENSGGFQFRTPDGVFDDLKPFIRSVWDTHKQFSGIQLSNSTHADGEPWTVVKDRYGSLEGKPKIPNNLIAEVFERKLADVTANPAAG